MVLLAVTGRETCSSAFSVGPVFAVVCFLSPVLCPGDPAIVCPVDEVSACFSVMDGADVVLRGC